MMRKKYLILSLLLITTFSFSFSSAAFAQSGVFDKMNNAIGKFDLPGGNGDPDAAAQSIIGKLINAFLSFFGIIFMVLIIYGGYRWMMARGNEDEVKRARDIIRGSVIGLIITLASYAIAYFVSTAIQNAI